MHEILAYQVTGDGDGRIRVWDTEYCKLLVQFAGHRCGVTALIATGTGQVISGGGDNDIWSWDLLTFKGEKLITGVPPVRLLTLLFRLFFLFPSSVSLPDSPPVCRLLLLVNGWESHPQALSWR
eukprot:762132-Hanusia_phi.AAC.5